MQKSTFGKLLLSGCLLVGVSTAAGLAIASQGEAPAKVMQKLTPGSPYIDYNYSLENGGTLTISVTVPRYFSNQMEITGTVDRLVLTRSCEALGETETLITTWQNQSPGNILSHIDNTAKPGYTYEYKCIAYSGSDASDPYFKNVTVGFRPERVSNLDVFSDNGKAPVTITFKTPNTLSGGDVLEVPLTYVRVTRDVYMTDNTTVEVARIENPEKNKVYTLKDEGADLVDGTQYVYSVYVGCDYGESYSDFRNITIGMGVPSPVTGINATVLNDESVRINWNLVTTAEGDAYLDPEEVQYDIYRIYGPFNEEICASGIYSDDGEYIDDITDFDGERLIAYRIIAFNEAGESKSATSISNYVLAGPPIKLPFVEHFNDMSSTSIYYDNTWNVINVPDKSGVTLVSWNVSNSSFFPDENYEYHTVNGVNYDPEDEIYEGFAHAQFGRMAYGETILESGRISMVGTADPTLTFYYHTMPGSQTVFNLEVKRPDGQIDVVMPIEFDDAIGYGWEKETVSLKEYAGLDYINIRFHAVGEKGNSKLTNIYLDEVTVEDDQTVVTELKADVKSDDNGIYCDLSWTAPKTETAPDHYEIELDGKVVATEIKDTAYRLENLVDGTTYQASVSAVFGEKKSTPAKITFKAVGSSVEIIGAAPADIRYFNLQGVEISNPEAGQTVIRVSTDSNGKTDVVKTVIR